MQRRPLQHYVMDDDPACVNFDVVWHFLSSQAYWGRWRTRETSPRGAWRVVGAYCGRDMG